MEKYTDKYHPQYIPGTYSIYSSVILRHQRNIAIDRYKYLIAEFNHNIDNIDEVKPLTKKKHYQLSDRYCYHFRENTPFQKIPDLKTRYGVILLPQPTNSQNDPLNWSVLRKTIQSLIVLLLVAFNAAVSNDSSAPADSINQLTGISYDTLNNSAGILFIASAFSTWFYSPFEFLLGRKSVLLFGAIFTFLGSIWFAKMKTNGDAFGSQLFIGFGFGSIDAHAQYCFSAIFFRHQLGAIITIYNFSFALGTYLGPLCANYISNSRNFKWVGWSGAIASAVLILLTLFLFEENYFNRLKYNFNSEDITLNLGFLQKGLLSNEESDDAIYQGYGDEKNSLWKRYRPFRLPDNYKFHNIKNFIKHYFTLFLIPFKIIWFPAIIYSGLICGLQNAVLSFYLTTEDTILYYEPFAYSSSDVALMNIPCIIGSAIGCLYAGSMTDYFILWMARKRDGIVESEYRLFFSFFSGTIGCIGLFMFGFGIDKNLDWRVFYVGLGFISYMFSSSNNLAMLYVMDTYRELMLESLVGVAFISNIIGCIFTFACSPWLQNSGTRNTYIALAIITLGVMYFAGIFIIWGKKWRKITKYYYVRLIEQKQEQ